MNKSSELYVIRKRSDDQFWNCSSEHGTGWTPGHPKQAFTKSELTKEIARLIEMDWFTDIIVMRLWLSV